MMVNAYEIHKSPVGGSDQSRMYDFVQQVQKWGWVIDQVALRILIVKSRRHLHESYGNPGVRAMFTKELIRMEGLDHAWRLKDCDIGDPLVPVVVECESQVAFPLGDVG